MITLPGLIDPHVHFRTPGQTHKEDFTSGTMAAIAGGFTTVIDMPNNAVPITTLELLKEKQNIAKYKIISDLGFYFGSLGDNLEEFEKVEPYVFGIKLYLNITTGKFIIDHEKVLKIYDAWPGNTPILVHAEKDVIDMVIDVVRKTRKKTHICHVGSMEELKTIIKAKKENLPITCGVTPHHLFLTEAEGLRLGPFGMMKPTLKTQNDVDFIWENLRYVDCIESDHAPHTLEEKNSTDPPFGVPGLETTLGLLLTACLEEKISIEEIKRLCHDGPAQIFNTLQDAKIEVDEKEKWVVENDKLFTKCKWSPFDNWKLTGKVKKVYIRGELIFENGKFLVKPGFGKVLKKV